MARAQGCGDAGACSLDFMKGEQSDTTRPYRHRVKAGISYGIAQYGQASCSCVPCLRQCVCHESRQSLGKKGDGSRRHFGQNCKPPTTERFRLPVGMIHCHALRISGSSPTMFATIGASVISSICTISRRLNRASRICFSFGRKRSISLVHALHSPQNPYIHPIGSEPCTILLRMIHDESSSFGYGGYSITGGSLPAHSCGSDAPTCSF